MPERQDTGYAIAEVYAEALFELARAAQAVDDVRSELEELVRFQEREPAFAAFLQSAVIDDDARARSLERMFRGRVNDLVLNTLQVMNRHGRTGLLQPLLRAYVVLVERARGEVEVTCRSAVSLDETVRAEVVEAAARLTGRRPLVHYEVDPELLGGLVLEIGDWRLDGSVRRQLRAAREHLLERGRRGLKLAVEAP